MDFSWIFRRFPAEFIGIFSRFIGDKTVEDFQGNPWRFSREIMENLLRNQGEVRGMLQYLSFFSYVSININVYVISNSLKF